MQGKDTATHTAPAPSHEPAPVAPGAGADCSEARRSVLWRGFALAAWSATCGLGGLTAVAGVPSVAVAATAPARPAAAATGPLLVLGDSLSAEYGIARGTGWVALLEARLKERGVALPVVNASISGETTAGGRTQLPALLQRHRPSIVVIELGANDALRGLPIAQTRANLAAMAEAARKAGARVLLVGIQVPPNYGRRQAEQMAEAYAGVAREQQAALVPFLLAGIADVPDSERWFQADRIHPLATAHPTILDNVWKGLAPLLPAGRPAAR